MADTPAETAAHQKALENVNRFIDTSIWFPEYVFKERWGGFLFFEPGWVTYDEQFAEEAKALLELEGSQCICIVDLDLEYGPRLPLFFFDKEITIPAYKDYLAWKYTSDFFVKTAVGRFILASNVGQWCIYCENQAEIGVIAIRDSRTVERYRSSLARFIPLPIEQAIAMPQTYAFKHLLEKWRIGLLKNYAMPGDNAT